MGKVKGSEEQISTVHFQDALFKKYSQTSFHERITGALGVLQEGSQALDRQSQALEYLEGVSKVRSVLSVVAERITGALGVLQEGYWALDHQSQAQQVSLEYLEGVAKVRFALSVVAELLNKQVADVEITSGHNVHHHSTPAIHLASDSLVQTARKICSNPYINVIDTSGKADTIGPAVYLLKLIARQYGFHTFNKVSEAHSWVVPLELVRNEEVLLMILVILTIISVYM